MPRRNRQRLLKTDPVPERIREPRARPGKTSLFSISFDIPPNRMQLLRATRVNAFRFCLFPLRNTDPCCADLCLLRFASDAPVN
jgi:hypothetical protein